MKLLQHLCWCALLLAPLLATLDLQAAGLPDTGQDTCYNDTVADSVPASDSASISGDAGSHPRQDCRYGRDAAAAMGALTKIGAGAKGFDYSKIANNGSMLAAGAALGNNPTDWACTHDNTTGLTWEVKTTSGLRDMVSTYTWYDTDSATNAGIAGTANGGICSGGTGCDTEKFVADVNTAALCAYTDWRMPTKRELLTLIHAGVSSPSIDSTYFPNTQAAQFSSNFWSASSWVPSPGDAWYVVFYDGGDGGPYSKANAYHVRLVRGVQF